MLPKLRIQSLGKLIAWLGWIVALAMALLQFLSSNPPPSVS